MVTSKDCLKKYGLPRDPAPYLVVWHIPENIQVGGITKIYCNTDLIAPLTLAFANLKSRGFDKEIKTYDGCVNIRRKRGNNPSYSLHAWGIPIDLNAFDNPFNTSYEQAIAKGLTPFTDGFLQCFRDAGFDCGGDWNSPCDRMHFQLKLI